MSALLRLTPIAAGPQMAHPSAASRRPPLRFRPPLVVTDALAWPVEAESAAVENLTRRALRLSSIQKNLDQTSRMMLALESRCLASVGGVSVRHVRR